MTSFKRTQRKYVQKAYRVRNWREYETGLRARGSLTVWLGLTDGKLANWNSPRPTRRKPGRQRQYSNHAIETTVTLGLVFGLASRQTEGFLRSLLTLVPTENLIRTVRVTDRADVGPANDGNVSIAAVHSVNVDEWLASFGRSSGRRAACTVFRRRPSMAVVRPRDDGSCGVGRPRAASP